MITRPAGGHIFLSFENDLHEEIHNQHTKKGPSLDPEHESATNDILEIYLSMKTRPGPAPTLYHNIERISKVWKTSWRTCIPTGLRLGISERGKSST